MSAAANPLREAYCRIAVEGLPGYTTDSESAEVKDLRVFGAIGENSWMTLPHRADPSEGVNNELYEVVKALADAKLLTQFIKDHREYAAIMYECLQNRKIEASQMETDEAWYEEADFPRGAFALLAMKSGHRDDLFTNEMRK